VKRYKYMKLMKLGPVDGFLIHTPDDRKLKDTHPQTIVRELNRLNDELEEKRKDIVYIATEKAKLENYVMRLEKTGDGLSMWVCPEYKSDPANIALIEWRKAKEAKP